MSVTPESREALLAELSERGASTLSQMVENRQKAEEIRTIFYEMRKQAAKDADLNKLITIEIMITRIEGIIYLMSGLPPFK